MRVVPPVIAEKLLVAGILVLTPLAMRYAATAVASRGYYLGYLAIPFAANWFLHGGEYNFCIGVALAFFTMGYWIRRQGRLTGRETALLTFMLCALYVSHIVALAVTCLCLGTLVAWSAVIDATNLGSAPRFILPCLWRRGRGLAMAAFPFWGSSSHTRSAPTGDTSPATRS